MKYHKSTSRITMVTAVVCLTAAFIALVKRAERVGDRSRRLADGSTMELREIVLAKDYEYHHRPGNRLQRFFAPLSGILPDFMANRFFPSGGGSFGFGTDGHTNLFVVTVNRGVSSPGSAGWGPDLARLVVSDEAGNEYDACWGANTSGFPNEVARGWQIRAFPRRSRTLNLRFIGISPSKSWFTAAEFKILNPAFASYSRWTPEQSSVVRTDGDLWVTLKEFQSGVPFRAIATQGDERTVPRKTRLVFGFAQDGRPVDNWRIQRLNLSDATGNAWFPYLDFIRQDFNWATNGTVEFLGALWPGEDAWKLDAEFVRTAGFSSEELWESPLMTIPAAGVNTNLNARFQIDAVTVELAGLAAPDTDQPDPFKWIAKYWGDDDKTKIISLVMRISPGLGKRRLTLVRAVDQNGHDAKLLEHRNDDQANQALILKPAEDARQLRFTFALQQSRFVQFLARPEFVSSNRVDHSTTKPIH